MVSSTFSLGCVTITAVFFIVSGVLGDEQTTCSLHNKCPEETPCCSQYAQCGVGAYCLGGCDPRASFSLDSCVPAPVCESKVYSMKSMDRIVSVDEYLGDSTRADWVYQGEPLAHDDTVLLTMPAESVGTVMASTTYMWYGNVKVRLKSSRGAGVVTAFILMSDVKDEIDFEWIGADLSTAQTNYYSQGIPDYNNSFNISGISDTFDNFHQYEIQWTPDSITWLVDGKVGRTKKRSETWNATTNQWNFPQTPARVQISLWPGGLASNAPGTIAWAGGPIDWNSGDIQKHGYYYATFDEIEVQCYNATNAPGTNAHKSYIYNDASATNITVEDTDKDTVLKSLLATGLNMDAEDDSSNSNDTTKTIPGSSSTGPGQVVGAHGNDTAPTTTSSSKCDATGFTQSCSTSSVSSSDSSDGLRGLKQTLGASAFAVVVAIAGAMWL